MATIWNTADKSANITLSGGSLIATTSSATQGAVRATASISGKTYIEAYILAYGGAALWSFGFANATASLAGALGSDANSVVSQPNSIRDFFNNASLGALNPTAPPTLTWVAIAFDPTAKLYWSRVGLGSWNNSATADPATGAGGRSVAAIAAGPYFPIFGANGSGAQCLANFGATDFAMTPPSGFSGLDANAQAYVASSKFLSYAALSPPQAALSASKLIGYTALSPPQNAVSLSKLIGYAVLSALPVAIRTNDHERARRPLRQRQPQQEPQPLGGATPSNPPGNDDLSVPLPRARSRSPQVEVQALAALMTSITPGNDDLSIPAPRSRRAYATHEFQAPQPSGADFFVSILW